MSTSFEISSRGVLRRLRSRSLSVALVFLLSPLLATQAVASRNAVEKQQQKVEQWKQALNKKGVGEKSRWTARLLDGRKITGYVSEIQEEGFSLVDKKTAESFTIAFSELDSLKPKGMPLWAKIAIVFAAFSSLSLIEAAASM